MSPRLHRIFSFSERIVVLCCPARLRPPLAAPLGGPVAAAVTLKIVGRPTILGGYPMGDPDAGRSRWQQRFDQAAKRQADFTTLSGLEVDPVYGPPPGAVVPEMDEIGWPGEFPFTRGIHASGYRGKPWTIRQFSGFGNARQTNERYKMLLGAGGTGLSVAFDMPTLMGRDSDDPRSAGEVGHCGVAIDSAADMDVLFSGIPLADVTTSMTISGPAVPVFCMYL